MSIEVTTGGPVASDSSSSAKDYDWLQSAVSNWMARSDLSGEAADFILLAEARLNRELGAIEVDETLTGTANSREIDISSLSMERAVALFLTDTSTGDEIELTRLSDGTFPYKATAGRPYFWSVDTSAGADVIHFDCVLDVAYTFRFRLWERFQLSDDHTTNWLLSNHPDLYLAATLVWGGIYTRDGDIGSTFAAILDEALPSVKNTLAARKRAMSRVDSGLVLARPVYRGGSE